MKKIGLFILLLLPAFMQAQTLRELFINMPDSICLLLTKNDRADFADFLDSKMRAQVKNKFGRQSEMKALTKDYLLLETTSASTLQMKLLTVNDSVDVILAVETCQGPASDSRLTVYSTSWQKLPLKDYITLPSSDDFLSVLDTIDVEKRKIALKNADMYLMKATLSPDADSLSFVYTTIDYMDKEAAAALRPFLKPEPLTYEWKDGRFILK